MMDRAWERFEDVDAAIRAELAELAELPGDLDVYLRLVRDKKRFEAHLRAQETGAMQLGAAPVLCVFDRPGRKLSEAVS